MTTSDHGADLQVHQLTHGRTVVWAQGDIKISVDDIPAQPFISFRATLDGRHAVRVVMRDHIEIPSSEFVELGIDHIRLTFAPSHEPGELCIPSSLLREMIAAAADS